MRDRGCFDALVDGCHREERRVPGIRLDVDGCVDAPFEDYATRGTACVIAGASTPSSTGVIGKIGVWLGIRLDVDGGVGVPIASMPTASP